MGVGLKHSHYWENQQLGGEPGNYLGAQVFWFQNFPRGRRREINPLLVAMLLRLRKIEEDDEDIIFLI